MAMQSIGLVSDRLGNGNRVGETMATPDATALILEGNRYTVVPWIVQFETTGETSTRLFLGQSVESSFEVAVNLPVASVAAIVEKFYASHKHTSAFIDEVSQS